jgi:hypothetical protein
MKRLIKALLLLNLEFLLLAPMCVQQKIDHGFKTGDQYWAETGLNSTESEDLLADDNCRAEIHRFF